jgi:hypothetical protein
LFFALEVSHITQEVPHCVVVSVIAWAFRAEEQWWSFGQQHCLETFFRPWLLRRSYTEFRSDFFFCSLWRWWYWGARLWWSVGCDLVRFAGLSAEETSCGPNASNVVPKIDFTSWPSISSVDYTLFR